MSGTTYTNLIDAVTDVSFYLAISLKGTIDLSMLPSLAKQRYTWMVTNWKTLYAKFKNYANGDQYLESALQDFDSSVRSYKLGNTSNVLDNSQKFLLYREFISTILVSDIPLSPNEKVLVSQEKQRISNLSIEDFRNLLAFLKQTSAIMSAQVGLGDNTGFAALGVSSAVRTHAATVGDLKNMETVLNFMKYVESIIYNLKQTVDKPPNLLSIANKNISNNATVAIASAYASFVDMPFEISLEHMALKYMGHVNYWYVLVTVNNLQPPYIDEVGEKFPLLAPGANNSLIVSADRSNDVHIGAEIRIGSRVVKEESRYVNDITKNSDNTMVLFLSGDPDLAKLKTTQSAFVRIYQPHTTNGGKFIKIPIALASPNGKGNTPQKDELRRLDKALLSFGVDIAQSETTGDLIVDANGNFGLAYGVKNVKQAVMNALQTTVGELPFHSGYGFDPSIGERFNGPTNFAQAMGEIVTKAILKDSRIQSARIKDIILTGTSVSMLVEVTIAGVNSAIPLSFTL